MYYPGSTLNPDSEPRDERSGARAGVWTTLIVLALLALALWAIFSTAEPRAADDDPGTASTVTTQVADTTAGY